MKVRSGIVEFECRAVLPCTPDVTAVVLRLRLLAPQAAGSLAKRSRVGAISNGTWLTKANRPFCFIFLFEAAQGAGEWSLDELIRPGGGATSALIRNLLFKRRSDR